MSDQNQAKKGVLISRTEKGKTLFLDEKYQWGEEPCLHAETAPIAVNGYIAGRVWGRPLPEKVQDAEQTPETGIRFLGEAKPFVQKITYEQFMKNPGF